MGVCLRRLGDEANLGEPILLLESTNSGRFGLGSFRPGRFGLCRFGQLLGWVVSALVGESFRPWVVSALSRFGPESFRPNFNMDRGSIW